MRMQKLAPYENFLLYSIIKSYLSAVQHLYILYNLPEPKSTPMSKLSLVEKGIHKSASKASPRLPISPDILCQIKALWSLSAEQRDTITVWAVCIACFRSFFPPRGAGSHVPTWQQQLSTFQRYSYRQHVQPIHDWNSPEAVQNGPV